MSDEAIENDDAEPPRELTENEKNIQTLMVAVSEFVNKYSDASQLPQDGIIISSHIGKIKLTFGEDPMRVIFQKQALIQLACAYMTQIAASGESLDEPQAVDVAEECVRLSRELWKKAEVLQ